MSDDSISDTGDINEGEGAKVVQSNFREPSILTKSIISHDLSVKKQDSAVPPKEIDSSKTVKSEKRLENPSKTLEKGAEKASKIEFQEPSPVKLNKKNYKKITDDLCFEIPKMLSIPVVNKDTTHPDRFDLDFLLDPKVQKIAQSGHRLTQSITVASTNSFVFPKNHIKKNIKNTKSHTNSISQKDFFSSTLKISHSKKSTLDVDERFYKKAKKTDEKIKALKEVKEMEEINGCTFHPKIKTKRQPKTYEEFYEYMNNFTDRKEKKLKNMQEEDKKAYEKSIDFNYQPKLCEKSLQIVAKKSVIEESAFDRLHKYYKHSTKSPNSSEKESPLVDSKTEPQRFFHPSVNKKSHDMQRSEPIETILYNDALRRLQKPSTPKVPENIKFINGNSEKFLIEKLKRDFEEGYCYVDMDSSGEINYTRLIELFRVMHLVQDNGKKEQERLLLLESWKHLTGEESSYCSKESVLAFILAIMGFFEDWMKSSLIVPSPAEVKRIHKKFELFYSNRVKAINKNSGNKASKDVTEYSFQPQISLVTDRLADSFKQTNRSQVKLEDALIAEKEKIRKKVEELRHKIEEEKMEECSFNPLIEQMPEDFKIYSSNEEKEDLASEYFKLLNKEGIENQHKGIFLYKLAKIYKEKKEVIAKGEKEREMQKVLENCTFMPHLEKRIFQEEEFPDFARKSEKNSPAKISEEVKKEPEKKIIVPQKSKENDLKKNSAEQKPKKKLCSVISNNNGIAKISVNIGSSKENLVFNLKNDDPTSVVMTFSQKFGLEKDDEYKLVKKLTLLKFKSD